MVDGGVQRNYETPPCSVGAAIEQLTATGTSKRLSTILHGSGGYFKR